ncbi:Phox homologous domain-containing protein [Calycina marina]|uniref:Endosomal/vacuolar adapter protein YPT35 n=1 Tax=Calycina marina TaxID=1763456 RepID=A0A9P7YV47_9HELO|nr:Phox homologous domain-containing protein [Calycina marina]
MEVPQHETFEDGRADSENVGASKPALDTNPPSSAKLDQTSSPITSPVTPPYWVQAHQRSVSNISIESIIGHITLQDNTNSPEEGNSKFCWARSVHIEDYVIVNEHRTGIGAFVVWHITVETLRGSSFHVRKRYSEFVTLRERLLQTFQYYGSAMPTLPPKSLVSKFRPRFLESRRVGLQYFLNCVLLNPDFSSSPVLKEFLFE